MPFGVIYGALFFFLLSIAMMLTAFGSGGVEAAARGCLALLALALAWSLLRRRTWARWGGALLASLLVVSSATFISPGSMTGSLLVLFGSLLTALLLLIPAFGDVRRGLATTGPSRSGADRLAALAALAGAAGFAVALGYGVTSDQAPREAPTSRLAKASSSPRWSDFESGLDRARDEGKPMLVNFVTDWCGYCRKMDRTTWKHPTVVQRLSEMVAVRVDADQARELALRYGVTGYPTIMLLDGGGAVISRTGGYQQPRQFLEWLEAGLGRVQG